MTLEMMLKIVRDAVNYIDAHGMFVNGTVDFANLKNDLGFAAAIEQSAKGNGVTIPEQVDRIVAVLPLLVGMFAK